MWITVYITILMHAMLVAFVMACTLLSLSFQLRAGKVSALYLACFAAVGTSQLIRGECVLTVVEKVLRRNYLPGTVYHNSFLGHYLPFIPVRFYDTVGPALLLAGAFVQTCKHIYARKQNTVRARAEKAKAEK